ncbi:MAG: M23 family metallopeptidase [Proteobacteria bacterium]|nr:M23 family metallopeptidase [Pseudomonadota bacterium]
MTCNAKLTSLATAAMIFGALILTPPAAAVVHPQPAITKKLAAEKRAEKRAWRFGKRLQTLSQQKKTFTQIKKKAPSAKLVLVEKVPVRLVRIQNLIIQGQMMMRAVPASLPVRGRISSVFGPRRHPRSQDFRLHAGVDIVARFGSPVVATADGRVVFSGERQGYGKVVVLDHGFGYQTVYAHNSQLSVPVGARVARGQVIARVGKSGHTTGTHLHYEVRKNGEPIDPKPYLKKQMPPSS